MYMIKTMPAYAVVYHCMEGEVPGDIAALLTQKVITYPNMS